MRKMHLARARSTLEPLLSCQNRHPLSSSWPSDSMQHCQPSPRTSHVIMLVQEPAWPGARGGPVSAESPEASAAPLTLPDMDASSPACTLVLSHSQRRHLAVNLLAGVQDSEAVNSIFGQTTKRLLTTSLVPE